jgi:hypothetical protein
MTSNLQAIRIRDLWNRDSAFEAGEHYTWNNVRL